MSTRSESGKSNAKNWSLISIIEFGKTRDRKSAVAVAEIPKAKIKESSNSIGFNFLPRESALGIATRSKG